MIAIYLHRIQPDTELDTQKLPTLIQQRIKKKKQVNKQKASSAGYLLLKEALRGTFNQSLDNLMFSNSGKPVFRDSLISFNISHSRNRVGVVVTDEGEAGLDIEHVRPMDVCDSSFAFYSAVEKETILQSRNPSRKLIEFWSKKRSIYKNSRRENV